MVEKLLTGPLHDASFPSGKHRPRPVARGAFFVPCLSPSVVEPPCAAAVGLSPLFPSLEPAEAAGRAPEPVRPPAGHPDGQLAF